MLNKNAVEIVKDRLILISRLEEARAHFCKSEDRRYLPGNVVDHLYKNYDALKAYLALTCFDILGQPSDWMTFDHWMKSKKKKQEREQILQKYSALPTDEMVLRVYEDYQNIYGVRISFYRFLRKILPSGLRDSLLQHIKLHRQKSLSVEIEPGKWSTPTMEELPNVSDIEKEAYLFKARNYFTHKGVAAGGSSILGMMPEHVWEFALAEAKKENSLVFYGAFKEKQGGEIIIYSVAEWPHILIRVLNETIEYYEKSDSIRR